MKNAAAKMGSDPINTLLIRQAVPASLGVLVMSLNILVDTIFVGQWIGADAIAAINVVLPVSFFIAAIGLSIGIGGGSIISRSLGKEELSTAVHTFGNQITLTLTTISLLVFFGFVYMENLIPAFGGKGNLYPLARIYYIIVLAGVPLLGLCMMGNNTIRAEGKPKYAMYAMMLPSISNLLLDVVFIKFLDWGMYGAAWATSISYGVCLAYIVYFFASGKSELKPQLKDFILKWAIIKEMIALGFVTLARQGTVSISILLINNILFDLSGETGVAVYAVLSRMLIFAFFPILGITQGFVPIAGYNYGAKNTNRVIEVIRTALTYACLLSCFLFGLIVLFNNQIPVIFTDDIGVITEASSAIIWVFAAMPIVSIQLIGAAYFQAIGKAVPALLLTLTRQGFFLIPLVYILPLWYNQKGVWMAFAFADFLATIVTAFFLWLEIRRYRARAAAQTI
ncbi:MAG: MATE family efflux transporter [Flavobacteriaceae bacterium]